MKTFRPSIFRWTKCVRWDNRFCFSLDFLEWRKMSWRQPISIHRRYVCIVRIGKMKWQRREKGKEMTKWTQLEATRNAKKRHVLRPLKMKKARCKKQSKFHLFAIVAWLEISAVALVVVVDVCVLFFFWSSNQIYHRRMTGCEMCESFCANFSNE